MKKSSFSEKLFAKPSFVGGFSTVLDIGTTLSAYNYSHSDDEADCRALNNDWRAVGEDLNDSIKLYEQEHLAKK